MIEAWEIDQMERIRKVREELDREFLEIPIAIHPHRPKQIEKVPSICEVVIHESVS